MEIDQASLADESPIAAADRFDIAGYRAAWVNGRRSRKIISIKPVSAPFPGIASHVMEAEGIGLETTDGADWKIDDSGRFAG